MKTNMRYLAYIIFSLFLGLAISSCEGPEGPQGLQGEAGLNGENGADGADGADGEDGVDGVDGVDGADGEDGTDIQTEVYIFEAPVWSDSGSMNFDLPELTLEVIQHEVVLAYLEYALEGSLEPVIYAVPGLHTGDNYYVKSWMNEAAYHMKALKWDALVGDYVAFLGATNPIRARIIIIHETEPETTSYTGESVLDNMRKAGVDTTNYNEVVAYLGELK